MSYKTAITNQWIVPVRAYYYELPQIEIESNNYATVYSKLIVNNEYRNQLIANLANTFITNNVPTLCLVKEIAHGKTLAQLTNTPFVCGADAESKQSIQLFNTLKVAFLIGTTGVLGEGVDTKPCEVVIIAGLGKAKSSIMQQIGRGVRKVKDKKECIIIIFKDKSHKFTLNHFKEQVNEVVDDFAGRYTFTSSPFSSSPIKTFIPFSGTVFKNSCLDLIFSFKIPSCL